MKKLFAPMLYRLVVLVLFAAAFSMMPMPAHSQSIDEPVLAVATPELQGLYQGTVLLAVPLGDQHIGMILNRPMNKSLADLFPTDAASKAVPGFVHDGGPMNRDAIFAMVYAAASPGPHSLMLMPGLWLVAHGPSVDRLIETRPNDARYYMGLVGWRRGELASEVRQGMFTLRPVDKSKLFLKDTSGLYQLLAPPPKGMVPA